MPSVPILTREGFYTLFMAELAAAGSPITDDTEGSIADVIGGVVSELSSEVAQLIIDEFSKTFFGSAEGPETTGGADHLQTLAVDHFGPLFARPAATKAGGEATFSRPTFAAGIVVIPAGTVIETLTNANGQTTAFETTAEVSMGAAALTIIAQIRAQAAGIGGNVASSKIVTVVSTLTDGTVTVNNVDGLTGGADQETTAEYRETIRAFLNSLKGATLSALEAAARAVAGVTTATAQERMVPVIEYDIALSAIKAGASFFRIPYTTLFVADANGTANAALVEAVAVVIAATRAAGVKILVAGASAVALNWSGSYTLNPVGPNFTELSSSGAKIVDSMRQYVADLAIGSDFVRATARADILAVWGPSGTNDLTNFTTVSPVGDVSVADNEKLTAGSITVV